MARVQVQRIAIAGVALGLSIGCQAQGGPRPSSPGPEPIPAAVNEAPAVAAEPPPRPSPPRTGPCTAPPGRSEATIEVDGVTREYLVYRGGLAKQGAPLLFVWHGFGSQPQYRLDAVAPDVLWSDAIVVAPRGLGRTFEQFGDDVRLGWQVYAGEHDDRDLHFFDALHRLAVEGGCVDPNRVYSTGFSNGAFFSNVLACHRADALAAVAPVGGGGPFRAPCGPAIPIQITHGRDDAIVAFTSAETSWRFWGEHAACATVPTLPAEGCVDATGCRGGVALQACVFQGGHAWPDEQANRIAKFLRAHARSR